MSLNWDKNYLRTGFGVRDMGRRGKRGGECVNNIGSYPHLLGVFFTGFTLLSTSVCAWQQHSDAFREHSSVFRDIFSALNYPRPMCPSCCALFPHPYCSLSLCPVASGSASSGCSPSTFPRFGCFSVSSRSSLGKTEGWEGKATEAVLLSIAPVLLTMPN